MYEIRAAVREGVDAKEVLTIFEKLNEANKNISAIADLLQQMKENGSDMEPVIRQRLMIADIDIDNVLASFSDATAFILDYLVDHDKTILLFEETEYNK